MVFIDRLLLTLLCIFALVFAIFFLNLSLHLDNFNYILRQFLNFNYLKYFLVAFSSIGFLQFFFNSRFLIFLFKLKAKDPFLELRSRFGKICVSLKAIQTVAENVVKNAEEVLNLTVKVSASKNKNSVLIGLKLVLDGKAPMQELVSTFQQQIKEKVKEITGIDVEEVLVYIDQVGKGNF